MGTVAGRNAVSLRTMPMTPFGRAEHGWEIYAPTVGMLIETTCGPESAQFAAKLAAWQRAHALPVDGAMSEPTFMALKTAMQRRRPFVNLRAQGICPAPPNEATLVTMSPDESRPDKPVRLRPGTLAAYHRLIAAARREVPPAASDAEILRVFSGYRSPASDGARCASEGNCAGLVRAACSAHRTGLAIDVMLGFMPGSRADSSEDANRLYQSRTAVYRWLVANAARFGFVNYAFEPWHWEWTGEPP